MADLTDMTRTERAADRTEAQRLDAVRACGLSPGRSNPAFDGIAEVAATTLRAPIALVSIVDEAEQWFAARVGLAAASTPRDVSFCAFAIQHPEQVFVVPDAHLDVRFRDNALVTGEPHIRFYAGAPIRSEDGLGLGSLCIIDTVPRPDGLSPEDRRVLELLARQVEQQLELLRYAAALDRTTAALARRERALDNERGFLSAALGNLAEGVVACDADGHLTVFNAATERMHGLPADTELEPSEWTEHYNLYEPDGSTPLPPERLPLLRALAGEEVRDQDVVIAPRGGPPVLVSCSGQAFHSPDGKLLGAVVTMQDVTERRRYEEHLRHSAEHDPLTGLANRASLDRRLADALAGAGWDRTALCFVDLNGFKQVNDELGHVVGDRVLAAVASRLERAVKASDTVARYGGDEFVLLLEDVSESAVAAVTARVHEVLREPLRIGRRTITVGAAVGHVHAGAAHIRDGNTLLRLADRGMYAQKPA